MGTAMRVERVMRRRNCLKAGTATVYPLFRSFWSVTMGSGHRFGARRAVRKQEEEMRDDRAIHDVTY